MRRYGKPTEHELQKRIIEWAHLFDGAYPELRYLFHVPNGLVTKKRLGEAKALGVKAGCPDLWLPVPRRGYHGLVIELKRPGKSVTRDNQVDWLDFLHSEGWLATLCVGDDDAIDTLAWYIGMRDDEPETTRS